MQLIRTSIFRQFVSLDKHDQRVLLARNTPLFVQLFIGSHLLTQSSHSTKTKAEGSFGKKAWLSNFFQNMHLEKFNSMTKLFHPGTDLDHYARLINKLHGLPTLSLSEQTSVFAFIILFDHSNDVQLAGRAFIQDISILNETLFGRIVKTCDECVDLPTLSKNLIEMANFCAKSIDWERNDQTPCYDDLSRHSSYTLEEENWMRAQFKKMDAAFRSVQTGEKLIQEFLSCAAGISPLSETHIVKVFEILQERARRVCKIHPEFRALSDADQQRVTDANIHIAQALTTVKADCCSNGMEQLLEGFGEEDERIWREKYLPYLNNPSDIRKLELANDPTIPHEVVMQHMILVDKLKILTSDPDMFKLNLLIVLTRQPVPGAFPTMDRVHSRYLTLLRRRLTWICHQNPRLGNPDQLIRKIFACHSLLPEAVRTLQVINARSK